MSTPEGRAQQDRDLQCQLPLDQFTLVIELDPWNILSTAREIEAQQCGVTLRGCFDDWIAAKLPEVSPSYAASTRIFPSLSARSLASSYSSSEGGCPCAFLAYAR